MTAANVKKDRKGTKKAVSSTHKKQLKEQLATKYVYWHQVRVRTECKTEAE